MKLKTFSYIETTFIIQAYLENDFANICEINGESFHIDFFNKKITTSGKETKDWLEKVSKININEVNQIIKNKLNDYANLIICQSKKSCF